MKIPENLPEQVAEKQNIQTGGVKALFASVVLAKNFFNLSFAWFSLNLAYFCLVLNVGKFGLSIFLVQLLFGVCEIPAHLICIWILEVVGRKLSLISTLLAGSAACFLTLAFSQDNAVALTVLATIGKFFFSWSGSVCMVYAQELFPTSVRQTAVGLASTMFRLGGLVAPLLNMLARYHWSIPITIFSSLTLVCAGLSILLPETRRMELPDSSEETESNKNMSTKKSSEDSNMAHVTMSSTKL
ncbi:solute carrier family 22 member 13-like [Thalassophryne amazonica]|uniref:solute carrier family 22 member 13-like n=1 Tax=Thalassophryne amazonica TaxID=390379 RepID=UPI0014720D48|nr:solute carrier family 22 member 13-like [Thalassophryne amazonica]